MYAPSSPRCPYGARPVVALLCAATVLGCTGFVGPREGREGRAAAGGTWSAAPASDDGARSQFYLEGEPGTVLKDTVSIRNEGAKARTYALRGTDARGTRGGAGAGKWIAFAEQKVRVPARTRADVPFTVTVPADVAPGDHPGAVVVGDGRRDAGIRMRLRGTGPALSALSVENVAVREKGDDAAEVAYTLVNRGNTVLTPRRAVRADGLFGPLLRRAARAADVELLPGQKVTLREPWPHPPALDSADVTVAVTAAGGARGEGSATYTALPWGVAAGLAVLAALGVLAGGGWYVQRRERSGSASGSGDVT